MEKKPLTEEQLEKRRASNREYKKRRYHSDEDFRKTVLARNKTWQEAHSEEYHATLRRNAAKWREEHAEYNKLWKRLYSRKKFAIKRGDLIEAAAIDLSMKMLQAARKKKKRGLSAI